ncbi:MAG: hypothetical protein GWO24_38405, partial [Akkermansiaceae bacterium]|nr:hypothetical protein [Akkermansiaceae bacterium]
GFVLLAVAAWSDGGETSLSTYQAVSFYLGTYLVVALGAFFVLALVRNAEDSDEISAFNGLGRRNPMLALCTTVLLAALAGLPLTAGFFGKFFAFQLAIQAAASNKILWWGVGLGFIGVAAGFYYYLKVIRSMYWRAASTEDALPIPPVSRYAIITLTVATLLLGIWPQPVLWLIGA